MKLYALDMKNKSKARQHRDRLVSALGREGTIQKLKVEIHQISQQLLKMYGPPPGLQDLLRREDSWLALMYPTCS